MTTHDLYPFGELLKEFRTRRHLTQHQLATDLGLHRNAISRWEQGDVLPASKAIVLELARYLSLTDQEARQLLEASLTALVPPWNVPHPRNPFFTGRQEILDQLHTLLRTDQAITFTRSQALHGLGGIGKTQVALEYAYRHALEYAAVFWIGAENSETILSSFVAIAEVLKLPEREAPDQQQTVAAVQYWLQTHSRWLLIWDNLEELELLQRFLPSRRQGTILITTRRQALGIVAADVKLEPLTPEEGVTLLLQRARMLRPGATSEEVDQLAARIPTEYAAAQEVVAVLSGLPLAVDQAGAYLEETGCGLSNYLDRYEQQRAALLARRGSSA
ncbi:MAG: helix-turn-helix domain-containing protein, partial [Ktedonobacteraceae bacterium]|nr:helix-turn-helix domain-containing protein [Ktedonobacteraceae bacterium]